MKTCSKCHQTKELEDFSPGKGMKDGRRSWCKKCSADYAHENQKPKSKNRTDYGRAYHLKRVFGITLEQYSELLEKQNHCCAICHKHESEEKRAFAVDHDHKTGFIRGLLCFSCNKNVIGRHTDADILLRASEYLRQRTDWTVPERFKKGTQKHRKRKRRIVSNDTSST